MTLQLQLRLDALRGDGRQAPTTRLRPGAPRPKASDSGLRLERLGFHWDSERSLWVRTERLSFADLQLSGSAVDMATLRALSPKIGRRLDGPVVCFDLETTGLQRGTGTVPFLYGWAVISEDGITVQQWLLAELGAEAPLVEAAHDLVRLAGLLVTYNGASFDLPLLRTRAVMTGVDRPWPASPHLDLLPLVRRLFRHRLGHCTLRRAEEELLGRPRLGDVPGSEAPARYREFLRRGDPAPLAAVIDHNRLDLLSLIRLIDHLGQHLEGEPTHPLDWYSLGRYAEARGNLDRAGQLYLGAEAGSPAPLDRAAALRRARLLRRQGDEPAARTVWESIWERWRDPEAAEALCIDMEHRTADPEGALSLAREALGDAPVGWDRRFAKRIWRLQARLGVSGTPEGAPASSPNPRPWAAWLPGGASYEAWLALRRGRGGERQRLPVPAGQARPASRPS